MPEKTAQLARHIQRVKPGITQDEATTAAAAGIGSYARYWVEMFRLPTLTAKTVGDGFTVDGFGHIEAAIAGGHGPILALPHLGSWEWAAAWLNHCNGLEVAAVAERLEPEELFDWFIDLRASYGIEIIPLGTSAVGRLTAAVRELKVVCLLADRDIGGNGVEVSFFGEKTTLPAGPALVARRTGAPLHPTAVYFDGRSRHAVIADAIRPDTDAKLRPDVARVTQELATALEKLIERAPDQWHLLQPNWPSDAKGARW